MPRHNYELAPRWDHSAEGHDNKAQLRMCPTMRPRASEHKLRGLTGVPGTLKLAVGGDLNSIKMVTQYVPADVSESEVQDGSAAVPHRTRCRQDFSIASSFLSDRVPNRLFELRCLTLSASCPCGHVVVPSKHNVAARVFVVLFSCTREHAGELQGCRLG